MYFTISDCCKSGDIDRVEELLNGGILPDDKSIKKASGNGYIDIVKLLMDVYDPSRLDNEPIINAFANGHINIVILLLNDIRVIKKKPDKCVMEHIFPNIDFTNLLGILKYLRDKNKIYNELTDEEHTCSKLRWDI